MKLYFVPQTRSTRPRWVLEELGLPYELVVLDPKQGDTKSAAHRARHPLAHVPVLEDGDLVLHESAAICLHLADKLPEKRLAPAPGTPARGTYYQWVFFTMTELEPQLVQYAAHTGGLPEAELVPALAEKAKAKVEEVCRVFEGALAGKPWLLGEDFTAADVILASCLAWANSMRLVPEASSLHEYRKRALSRPAAKKARE